MRAKKDSINERGRPQGRLLCVVSFLDAVSYPEKSSTFAPEIKPQVADEVPMKKRSAEELEAEVKRLTKELEWAKLQNKALNTLIDIAEEQGIRIRKKSGAKQ